MLDGRLPATDLVRGERRDGARIELLGAQFRLDLGARASAHQRFALRQAIGEEQFVMARVGVGRPGGDEEIDRHDVGSLMQHLEKGVLAIGAGLAPDHRRGRHRDRRAVVAHRLAVRFHFELLQIGGKAAEPLVVGDDRMGGVTPDVAIPDADEPHQHRNIVGERRLFEMLVDIEAAAQKIREMFGADGDGERQPDRRPDRSSARRPNPRSRTRGRARCRTFRRDRAWSRPRRNARRPPPRRARRR